MSTRTDDSGFTLVELLVASLLLLLVIGGVGSAVLSSMSADRALRDTTSSATTAQLAAAAVTRTVRNAHALDLGEPSPGTYMLRALVVDDPTEGAATAHCEAFFFGGGEIRATRAGTAIAAAAPSDAGSWTLLTDGVTAAGGPMAALDERTVHLEFQVARESGHATLVRTSAVSRQTDPVTGEAAALPAPLQEDLCF